MSWRPEPTEAFKSTPKQHPRAPWRVAMRTALLRPAAIKAPMGPVRRRPLVKTVHSSLSPNSSRATVSSERRYRCPTLPKSWLRMQRRPGPRTLMSAARAHWSFCVQFQAHAGPCGRNAQGVAGPAGKRRRTMALKSLGFPYSTRSDKSTIPTQSRPHAPIFTLLVDADERR